MFQPIVLARIFFVGLATACGYWVSLSDDGTNSVFLALVLSLLIVLFEYSLRSVSPKHMVLASVGLLFGLVVSMLVFQTIPPTVLNNAQARIMCNLLFGYLGVVMALKNADHISLESFRFILSNPESELKYILDTSVIIDGRIEDLLIHDFLTGAIICPSFVIGELQALADSSDPLKRGKGRRGLSILKKIQDECPTLQIMEKDYPEIHEVDRKLLELARDINARVISNDYNLQKVADLHKVSIFNINELANFLKPTVFVGESFNLMIAREGKESSQGVGYLQDGTMVVVDDGVRFLNTEIPIAVTSILQTNTGRMIFARPTNQPLNNGHSVHH